MSTADDRRPRRVVIVGGGISGLSIAHALLRSPKPEAPIEILVLEAAGRAGGNIRSERLSGYLCEWGPNGFLDNAPATLELVRRLGLEERLLASSDAARRRFVYRDGALREVPEGIGSLLRSDLLSWRGKLRLLGEPFARAPMQDDETIHDFAQRRIGREAAEILVGSMVSGIFGGDARKLSLGACFPRMREMEKEYGSLVRAMICSRRAKRQGVGLETLRPVPANDGGKNAAPGMPGGRLTSFREGVQVLIDGLGHALGDRVRVRTPVASIRYDARRTSAAGTDARHGPQWRIATMNGEPIEADAVVMAVSAHDGAPLVRAVDDDAAGLLLQMESAPILVVCLGYERSRLSNPLDGFGFLVAPGQPPRILGVLWDSSIFPNRAPEGRVLIRAMIGGSRDPSAINLPDESLLDLVRKDLATTMRLDLQPSFVQIFRHPAGIPQYTVGHRDRLARIEARLSLHPGLYLGGNSYRGVSMNACIAEAEPLALRIIEWLQSASRSPAS